jgi:hypothetical protein
VARLPDAIEYGSGVADVVERYLTLGLALGRHVDGLVDSYYGPAELQDAVNAAPPVDPAELAAQADALATDVSSAAQLGAQRRGWLADQIQGLGTYARVLAGESLSYTDEVEQCYGVRPQLGSEAAYAEAHEELEDLLPGGGPLHERYETYRRERAVEPARMVPALRALIAVLRARMETLVALPEGEELVVEEVRDEPWWAFNYYLGGLRSRVVMNSDQQTTAADLVTLAAHEAYPGHHTERVVKEQLLVRAQGHLEESVQLVPTPQSLVGEGIAELGLEVVMDDELQRELEATLTAHGLDGDLARAFAIGRARRPMRGIGLDVALMLHEHGLSTEEARAHYERWAMSTPERSASAVRFATDPTWRAYAVTYSGGRDLCSRYVAGDPARFRTLLTEQVRVGDLLAAS